MRERCTGGAMGVGLLRRMAGFLLLMGAVAFLVAARPARAQGAPAHKAPLRQTRCQDPRDLENCFISIP